MIKGVLLTGDAFFMAEALVKISVAMNHRPTGS
jgi:hypothetical protein